MGKKTGQAKKIGRLKLVTGHLSLVIRRKKAEQEKKLQPRPEANENIFFRVFRVFRGLFSQQAGLVSFFKVFQFLLLKAPKI
jgi:hypothetical protein